MKQQECKTRMDQSVKLSKTDVTARVKEQDKDKISKNSKNSKLKPYLNPKSHFEQQTALHC